MPSRSSSGSDARAQRRVERVETAISHLLRTGVAVSIGIVVSGTVLSFLHHPEFLRGPMDPQRLSATGAGFPSTLGEAWRGAMALRGQSVVAMGLIVLIATPILRVAVSILAFVYQKDWRFVVITSIVLALLIASFFLGKVE